MMISGIYMIQNTINNKIYIGQSKNILNRWASEKSKRNNIYLNNAIKKYGIDKFNFKILKECNIKKLNFYERYYILKYKSNNNKYGYNMQDGGKQFRFSKDYLTPVFRFNMNGKLLNKYISISDASEKNKISHGNISRAIKNKSNAGGFYWSKQNKIELKNMKCNNNIYSLNNYNKPTPKILQLDNDNNIIHEFKSIYEINNSFNISIKKINQCLYYKGKYKITHNNKDYRFIRKYNINDINNILQRKLTPVLCYDNSMNLLGKYNSVTSASIKTGTNKSCIFACIKGKQKTAGKYIWKKL
jgi:group I intron endonuclease